VSISATVETYLSRQGVEYESVPHPRTASSKETAQAAHVPEDHIAKAVILKDERGYAMLVIPANQWVRLHAVQRELNRELSLASEEEVEALFQDCSPGAVPPLGPAYGLETLLDEALGALAFVYVEAGDHERLLQLRGEDYRQLLSGCRRGSFSHSD